MSSYGEDFSDEERNHIEHGDAAQGESDVEESGPGEGELVLDLRQNHATESGGGDGGVGVVSDSGVSSVFGAAKGNDTAANSAEVEGTQGDLNVNGTEWRYAVVNNGTNHESGNPGLGWNDAWGLISPAKLPIGDLQVTDFCERLKLFRSPEVTILVGPEEVLFNLPKDFLCLNSKFFDRALNGKFKEGVERVIRLPEDTVMAFQMMLQWIYTGNIKLATDMSSSLARAETTGFYLEFFKLADKIDLLGSTHPIVEKFRKHLQSIATPNCWFPPSPSDCDDACRLHAGQTDSWSSCCTCRSGCNNQIQGHDVHCRVVYYGCSSKETHIDPLRCGIIDPEHIHTAFELSSGHGARKVIAQACVTSYLLSGSLDFEFRFAAELTTVDGFCRAILDEVAGILVKDSKMIDPLRGTPIGSWPPNLPA
ncbi:hypothetical protein VTL71DRAFT_3907 [Oculimacula yallundae]|uniref:BTB domain-containing protein n=1 Tax=Oculimacula yallundae TaxID=86028 RepID=A0ABR4C4B8_9HELO